MHPKDYFTSPITPAQKQYEALKAFYVGEDSALAVAKTFGFSLTYFKRLRLEFRKKLRDEIDPFFLSKKPGPQKQHTHGDIVEAVIALRKKNHSIADIKAFLHAKNKAVSLDTIDKILKTEGFAPLPKRTREERHTVIVPKKLIPLRSVLWEMTDEEFTTEMGAGPLLFLPLLEKLSIIPAIEAAQFPETSTLNAVQMLLSFLALKLLGERRWSHDTGWNLDRALGFFAGLNVLPKSTTLSTYSYRVSRQSNRAFLLSLSRIFRDSENPDDEFNLDFKAIPHWGDKSVLEKNWAGSRSQAMKSLLALIVQAPLSGQLSYTNADIKHRNQNDAVLEFVDFWKQGQGVAPKMLIFDSKFTSYKNLNTLNQSKEKIKFLTLRRRGKNLVEHVSKIPEEKWQKIYVERTKGKKQRVRAHDGRCTLRHYKGELREIIITDHGRQKPAFLITNDFDISVSDLIKKYARRWLVEQEIAEQVMFFQLNHPSSSIVVKVDFDLTLSLLAHNLYREMAKALPGFEHCTADTIHRKFLENGARVRVKDNHVQIHLKKKTHLPILFELPWLKQSTPLSWMKVNIQFLSGTGS